MENGMASKWWIILWSVSLFLGGVPLIICSTARVMGILAPADGHGAGANHGDWYGKWQSLLLTFNWIITLPLWTLISACTTIMLVWIDRKAVTLFYGVLLVGVNAVLWFAFFSFVPF